MTLSIISPTSGSTVKGQVLIEAQSADQTVTVFAGSKSVASDVIPGAPLEFSVDSMQFPDGPLSLTISDSSHTVNLSLNVANAPVVSPTLLQVLSPNVGDTVAASFNLSGNAGSQWVNVGVWDHATNTKIGSDVSPVNGAFSIPVSLGSLSGIRQLDVIAFSVPSGQPGGTQATVSVSVSVPAVVPPPVPVSTLAYAGLGSHWVQGGIYQSRSLKQQAADIMNICGPKATSRQDAYSLSDLTTHVNTLVPGFAPVQIVSCFIPNISGTPAQAYKTNYALGQQAAAIVAGHVPLLEFGNEWNLVCAKKGALGKSISDFTQSSTAMYMAAMAGFTQGFRAADPTSKTKLGINCTYVYFGWLQMTEQGILPDGSKQTTLPIIADIITWHDYMTGGDMDATNAGGIVNIFDSIKALTPKPIWFSECGAGAPGQDQNAVAKYIQTEFPEFLAHSQVIGFNYYQAYDFTDGVGFGAYDGNGNITGQGSALKAFLAANLQ